MRPLSAAAWAVLAVLALVAAVGLVAASFTRFDGGDPPAPGDPRFAAYEDEQYDRARLSAALGLAAGFAFLGGAACAQNARRARQAKRSGKGAS